MKNFVQPGDVIDCTAPYDRLAGEPAMVGNLFGVACEDALNGAPMQLQVTGCFDLPKTSAQAWATLGLPIYWDAANKVVTTAAAAGANQLVAVNIATAANPSETGRVRLGVVGLTA